MLKAQQRLVRYKELHVEMPQATIAESFLDVHKYLLKDSEQILLILDFKNTKSIDPAGYFSCFKLKEFILKNNHKLISENMNSKLAYQLRADNVLEVFNVQTTEAPHHFKHKLDVEFISPFISATIITLNIQAGLQITSNPPVLKENNHYPVDILGNINLVSNVFNGNISLCFPKSTFLKICTQLFGEEYTEINQEIEDAAAELLNMIYGSAKAELNKKDYKIEWALPTIVSGSILKQRESSNQTLVLPFSSKVGQFHLEFEIVDNPK